MKIYRNIDRIKIKKPERRGRKPLRLLAFLLCASLMITACPYIPETVSGTVRAQAAGAEVSPDRSRAADSGHTNHTGWTKLTSSTSTLTAGTNYYLESDVAVSSVLSISGSGTINLCLNGCKLTKQYASNVSDAKTWLVTVPAGVTLNVHDCQGGGILGAGDDQQIGGICVNGTLNVYGGSICGQSRSGSTQNPSYQTDPMALAYASAVYAGSGSVINLYGGSIEGKAATCVYVESAAKLTVDGAEVNNTIDCTSRSNGNVGVSVMAIYVNQGGRAEVRSGRVSATAINGENQSSSHNGSIAVMPTGSITISGGTVESTGERCYGIVIEEDAYWLQYVTVEKGTTYADISGGLINTDVYTRGNDIEVSMTGGEIRGFISLFGGEWKMNGSGKIGTASAEKEDIVIGRLKGLPGKVVLTGALTNSSPYLVRSYVSLSSQYPLVFAENFTTYMPGKKPADYFTSMDGYKVVLQDGGGALTPYVMTFDANGGTCDTATGDINGGQSMRTLPEPTRDGYSFDGWYTEKTAGDEITIDTIPAGRDITVYAHWTLVDYAIRYDLAGGALPSGKTNPSSYTVETAAFTLANPVRTGYTFTGWSGTGLEGSANKTVSVAKGNTGEREFTAHWLEASYGITYNKNGGTIANESSYGAYTYGTGLTLPIPARTGYTFGGWYTDSSLTGTAVTKITGAETGAKTYYAKWTANTYTITYTLDGGTVSGNPADYTIESGDITLVNPTKEGYSFAGWSGTGLTGSSNKNVTIASGSSGNRTYTAHWGLADYTVTLHTNGGSGGTELTSYVYGTGTVLPVNWTRAGYTFDGWYDNESCSGEKVTEISDTAAGDKEYWAKWTDNTAPVIGTLTYSDTPTKRWQWLMGKDSLVITVPVTEEGSGAEKITYTVTPEGGSAEEKTADINDGKAEITVSADFKGMISITCTDKAGNTSAGVIVGAGLDATGILIENHAPQITFQAEHAGLVLPGEYDAVPDIAVTITDNKNNVVSSGIASVRYQIGNGSAETVPHDYTTAMTANDSFTISAGEIPEGETVISVTATDHAGNSATETFTVKVHTHSAKESVPEKAAGCTETGNQAYYLCTCGKRFSDSGCTAEVTEQDVVIAAKGHDFTGEYQRDEKDHWKKCIRCEEIQTKEKHSYENETDRDCNVCGYERTIEDSPGETGAVSKDVEKDEKAPDTTFSNSAKELADILLTEEEKEQVGKGTDIKFILDVKDAGDTISSGDKSAVQGILNRNSEVKGFAIGQYLDISLFKVIGENHSTISQTAKKLTIVINVPDSLKGKNSGKSRTYAVIRVHGGVAETLEDLDDDANTITIATDRFSAYAIVYQEAGGGEEVTPTPLPTPGGSSRPAPATAEKTKKAELHSGLKAVKAGEKLQIAWGRVSGADGYSVYVQYCGKNFGARSLNQVKSGKKTKINVKKVNGRKLDTTKNVKLYVVAWQRKNGKKSTLARTITIHVAGKDSVKYTNVKKIQVKKKSYTLKKGGTVTLRPKAVLQDKKKKQLSKAHTREFRYLSSSKKVAAVSAKGKVRAKGAGSCTIYVFAKNGCRCKIKIKVK